MGLQIRKYTKYCITKQGLKDNVLIRTQRVQLHVNKGNALDPPQWIGLISDDVVSMAYVCWVTVICTLKMM